MKKIISIMLCLALLLGCTVALAESEKTSLGTLKVHEAFELKCDMPEGYSLEVLNADASQILAVITSHFDDDSKPAMMLSIAYDELRYDVDRLNDLDDETLAELEDTFREEDQVEITYKETALGTKLMVIKETEDDIDYVDIMTIYKGYDVEFVLVANRESASPLTEEQIQSAVDFLSNLDFVPVE